MIFFFSVQNAAFYIFWLKCNSGCMSERDTKMNSVMTDLHGLGVFCMTATPQTPGAGPDPSPTVPRALRVPLLPLLPQLLSFLAFPPSAAPTLHRQRLRSQQLPHHAGGSAEPTLST